MTVHQSSLDIGAAAEIARLQAELLHSRKIFDRASEAARIGVWECTLPDEALSWTDVVFDLFDLPRGCTLDRGQILACYTEASREALTRLRGQAIAERSGFTLDAEIVTFRGRRRWIRVTATVESENGRAARIFGMKQDITEERLLWERTRYLAEFDVMTGLANRSQFQTRLATADSGHDIGALLLVDLDGFKQINDSYGHAVGDDGLREAARRLAETCRGVELVARIGGDEFAVLLGTHATPAACDALAAAIIAGLSRPLDIDGRRLTMGASVGIAQADGCSASDLFVRADAALYAAKAAGRNTARAFGRLG
ncbi:MAG: diguanylate cyclase domain-containing protein [Ferrovibrionaceae bacterium]